VKIIVIDESGADKASFLVSEAWPTKYDPSDLNGKGKRSSSRRSSSSTRASSGRVNRSLTWIASHSSAFRTDIEFNLPKGYIDETACFTARA